MKRVYGQIFLTPGTINEIWSSSPRLNYFRGCRETVALLLGVSWWGLLVNIMNLKWIILIRIQIMEKSRQGVDHDLVKTFFFVFWYRAACRCTSAVAFWLLQNNNQYFFKENAGDINRLVRQNWCFFIMLYISNSSSWALSTCNE